MVGVRVEWDLSLSREIRTVLEPYVARYSDLIPPWCHTLEIMSAALAGEEEGDLSDCVMAMSAQYKYRRTRLFVHTDYLDQRDDEREQMFVHELVHVLNAPLIDFTDQLIAILEIKAPDAKEMMDVLHEGGMEAATEDTAMLLWRLTEGRRHPDVDWKFV